MKKHMHRGIALLMAALIAAGHTGCGTAPANSSDKEASSAASSEKDPVEIVLWHPASFMYGDGNQSPEDTFAGQKIAEYEESHNVKITIVSQPQDNFDNLFKAANMAKNGPDAVWLWPGSMTTDYSPFLVSLNDYLTEEDMAGHFGWNLASEDYDETKNIYGIPFTSYTYVIYYNKALFAQAGLTEKDIPKTWDAFMDVCKKLDEAGITPFVCGAKDGYIAQWGISALMSTMLGNDTSLVTSGNPLAGTEFEQAALLWSKLGENGYVNKNALSYEANGEALTEFLNGKGAMYLNSDWVADSIADALGEDAGFFPFPDASADSPNSGFNYAGAGCNICAVNYSEHIDETVDFIKFMTSSEFETGYCNEGGYLPNSTTIDIDSMTVSDIKKDMYALLKSGKNSIQVDLLPLNAFNTLVRNGSLLTMGEMSPEEFTKLIDEELANAN